MPLYSFLYFWQGCIAYCIKFNYFMMIWKAFQEQGKKRGKVENKGGKR